MRITVVSAHYPPNFVSGGTLQPQRLARGLHDRGHNVSVFAGWLGDRPALDTWDEVDETGLAIRWVSSGSWIGWADENNWNNPAVARVFRQYLEDVAPDIVHIHSLQSLGAGILPAAKAAGARVVVTMHDFWWLCARQFLVDRENQPCALVQSAGHCPCESGVAARDRRRESLATLLASADLVIAPSRSAAEVLTANGVHQGHIQVDENGLDVSEIGRCTNQVEDTTSAHASVRFLYTGGPNPMKGAHVLVDAIEMMHARHPWHLDAYGIGEYLTKSGRAITDSRVTIHDPYAADDLAPILAAHDVLVLPSVMRETHSLVTREALSAGLVVICTDSLGPEEVVSHGHNGLVVPTADASALAAALDSVVDDTKLFAQLRSGARDPFPIRTLVDQLDGLEATFSHLLEEPVDEQRASRTLRQVLFVCGIEGAPLRYRARLPAEALATQGVHSEVRHYRDPDLLALGGKADAAVFYRVPATEQVLDLIRALRFAGVAVAFDVDDLIFDPDIRDEIPAMRMLPQDEADLWLQGIERYRTTMEACDGYIGSTTFLVDHARAVTGLPSYRFANGVGSITARRSDDALRRPRSAGPLRIGYLSGTTTHDEDWFHIEGAVVEVLESRPDVELWLVGHLPSSSTLAQFSSRVVRLEFQDWRRLPDLLRDIDVNLAPLSPDSRFNEAKSAIKWLEAALCSTPTVASPTEPFREAIDPGRTGLLASTHEEWVKMINVLLDSETERARIGALARRDALLRWSSELQGIRYVRILQNLIEMLEPSDTPPRPNSNTWIPVTLDEPAIPGIVLDAYEDTVSQSPLQRGTHSMVNSVPDATMTVRLARVVDRFVASIRSNGLKATVRKCVSCVQARLAR